MFLYLYFGDGSEFFDDVTYRAETSGFYKRNINATQSYRVSARCLHHETGARQTTVIVSSLRVPQLYCGVCVRARVNEKGACSKVRNVQLKVIINSSLLF